MDGAINPPSKSGLADQTLTQRVLIGVFLVGITLPLLGYLADPNNFRGPNSVVRKGENRWQKSVPQWNGQLATLWKLPKEFEQHFNDCFGYREHLVGWSACIKAFGLGDSSHREVVRGRNGWLYFAWDQEGHSARNPTPFTSEQVFQWRAVLEARDAWCKQRHCRYMFVVAPEKQSVYPDFLPAGMPGLKQISQRTTQLKNQLRGSDFVNFLDLGDVLRAVPEQRLFHKADTHWNDYGAFVAYSAILNKLSETTSGLDPMPAARISRTVKITKGGNLAIMMGLSSHISEESLDINVINPQAKLVSETVEFDRTKKLLWFEPLVWVNANQQLPKALVFGDSFSFAMNPWFAEHFSRLVYVPRHTLDPKLIEREKPDVIIHEVVERKLYLEPPEDPVYQFGSPQTPRLADDATRATQTR